MLPKSLVPATIVLGGVNRREMGALKETHCRKRDHVLPTASRSLKLRCASDGKPFAKRDEAVIKSRQTPT